jgi:hypothetical protein
VEAMLERVTPLTLRWVALANDGHISPSNGWVLRSLLHARTITAPAVLMATYSAATCAPFAATEGFIRRTRKESATPTTARTRNVSK